MKFKNETGQAIQIRLNDGDFFSWKFVLPGEEAELNIPLDYAERIGLSLLQGSIKPTVASIGQTKVETKQVDVDDLVKDIDKIKGVGKKILSKVKGVIEENTGGKK